MVKWNPWFFFSWWNMMKKGIQWKIRELFSAGVHSYGELPMAVEWQSAVASATRETSGKMHLGEAVAQ